MERYPPTAQQRPVRSDWQRDRHRFDGGLRLLHLGTCSVLVQILDGLAAACLGVLVPLVTSDVAGRSGHFNLALGFIGLAIGIGATASTSLAGWIADWWAADRLRRPRCCWPGRNGACLGCDAGDSKQCSARLR